MGHSGQGVFFEPFTRTVLTPFAQGNNYALTAFHLAAGASPVLVQRQAPDWTPPDLVPEFIAIRAPNIPATCAPP